jgi:hypothetical protein
MNEPEDKFKYDICRVVGHETSEDNYICARCDKSIIKEELEKRLSTQFLGRKITAELPNQLSHAAITILTNAITTGSILAFQNLSVRTYTIGHHELTVDIMPCYGLHFYTIQVNFNYF